MARKPHRQHNHLAEGGAVKVARLLDTGSLKNLLGRLWHDHRIDVLTVNSRTPFVGDHLKGALAGLQPLCDVIMSLFGVVTGDSDANARI